MPNIYRTFSNLQRIRSALLSQPLANLPIHLPIYRALLEDHDVLRQRSGFIREQDLNLKDGMI